MFSEHAPRYWAAGLPVIPLLEKQKRPAPNAWQTFSTQMPDADTQAQWLSQYADGNIGLPLGTQSKMLAIDLDTDDPKILQIILSCIPHTPWVRRGKKGAVYMFRYNGERTTRIKGEDGSTIVEILSQGTQVVLPPSIHPDTQRPYEANADLVDVASQLVPLPKDFEATLRKSLIDAGIKLQSRGSYTVTKWVPAGGRDSAMVSMAGLFARDVIKGDKKLQEVLNEMDAWVANFVETVVGDPLDPAKAQLKIMEFLRRDVCERGRVLPTGWEAGMSDQAVIDARAFFGEDLEEWTLEEYITHLTDQFSQIPRENQAARTVVIDDVLVRIAKSQHFSDMHQDVVLQFIQNSNARLLNMGSMRKRLKDLRGSGELAGNDHTEIAQALIAELSLYGELRFEGSTFYQWVGSHWGILSRARIMKVLAEDFGHLPAAKKANDHRGILTTMQNLVPGCLKDLDIPGINFADGFLTTDMQMRPHDSALGARYVMPYRYAPDGAAPLRFLALLDQVWGKDKDYVQKVQTLREAFAATLFNMSPRFSRAVCLYGPPKTGKSTVMSILEGMIPPEGVCQIPPQDWGDKFLPSQMDGKLLNVCGELSETQPIAGDRFKSIVEGAEMSGQYKGQDIFKFRPLCSHWFASNHAPKTRDTSGGFNRRWLFLTFNRFVHDRDKIIGLDKEILAEEREAIAAWCVGAIQDLLRNSEYTLPQSHTEVVSEVASQNNSVRFFMWEGGIQVHDTLGKNNENKISEQYLYQHYYMFCRTDAHVVPVQLKRFRLIMLELQQEINFNIRIDHTPAGEVAYYERLTYPGRAKGAA
jgi:putative DNA primase/helicase